MVVKLPLGMPAGECIAVVEPKPDMPGVEALSLHEASVHIVAMGGLAVREPLRCAALAGSAAAMSCSLQSQN